MTHGYLEVKNWAELQHYKDRDPLWIKLYRRLQDNYEWLHLPDASKGHLVGIWILASKHGNRIPADPAYIAQRIGATERVNLEVLMQAGFIAHASNVPAIRPRSDSPERETETERETKKSTTTSASAAIDGKQGDGRQAPHSQGSCMRLVVERLYFGKRPSERDMATNGSVLRNLATRYGFDRMANIIEGLSLRRDRGELYGVGVTEVVSLKWLNSNAMLLNQLAVSEDALYQGHNPKRQGNGGMTDLSTIIGNIGA